MTKPWLKHYGDEIPHDVHLGAYRNVVDMLLAAAEVRLTRNAKFPARRFAARVEEIIRTEVDAPAGEDET